MSADDFTTRFLNWSIHSKRTNGGPYTITSGEPSAFDGRSGFVPCLSIVAVCRHSAWQRGHCLAPGIVLGLQPILLVESF